MGSTSRLTALAVGRQKTPGRYADGDGLYLQVSKTKTKAWLFRFMLAGRAREMGLGSVELVSLAEARDAARDCRKLLRSGVDPIDVRRREREQKQLAASRQTSFRECAEKYIAAHEPGWKNEKHRHQWKSTLQRYVYPVIGELAVNDVDTPHVIKIIEPLWSVKTETAGRIRGRIESVLDWAKAREFRTGENPARWKGHLDHLLPKRSKVSTVRHHPALPFRQMPEFMQELRARKGQSARALEFTILTAARTGATIGAHLSEFDNVEYIWTVPPERAGSKISGHDVKPRRVPLTSRVQEIIAGLRRQDGNPYLFAGDDPRRPLSNMAMLELMREMRPGFVPHGFRSTFKDWCSETTNFPNEVSEAALWHVVADKVEAAYRRGELFEKRRALMNDWARFCNGPEG